MCIRRPTLLELTWADPFQTERLFEWKAITGTKAKQPFAMAMPDGSPLQAIRTVEDADRMAVRIAAVRGDASTTALARVLKTKPVYVEDLEFAFDLLRTGGADALAWVREVVLRNSGQLLGSRVLEDAYDTSLVAIAIQKNKPGRLAYVSKFLDAMKQSGWLRRVIADTGWRGFEVITPKEPTEPHPALDVNPRHGRIVNVKREMSSTFRNRESQFGAVLGAGPCNRVYSTVKRES
jgi:hypothetical protein